MLKGNNVVELNSETVRAAVQEYLNRRITSDRDKVVIDSVCATQSVFRFHTAEQRKETVRAT